METVKNFIFLGSKITVDGNCSPEIKRHLLLGRKVKSGSISSFSHVQFFATPWTIARQAPLSMGFSRQEYWSGLPFPRPRDLTWVGKPCWPPLLLPLRWGESLGRGRCCGATHWWLSSWETQGLKPPLPPSIRKKSKKQGFFLSIKL